MQGGRAVEQHRVVLDALLQHVPHFGALLLDHLLGLLDGRHQAPFLELVVDEGLEQLERHLLRQAALVQPQLGPDDDDRAAGVVHALAEQVLAEAPLLALEGVGERLERPVVGAAQHAPAPPVVEQRVDGLLQHPLLVADDHVGRLQLHELLQPVVAVDDAPVEVVEVRGGEAAAVERHQRTQLGGNHRDDVEDHPLRLVVALAEGVDHAEPLGELLAFLLRRLGVDLVDGQVGDVGDLARGDAQLLAHVGQRTGEVLGGLEPQALLLVGLRLLGVAEPGLPLVAGVAQPDVDRAVVAGPLEGAGVDLVELLLVGLGLVAEDREVAQRLPGHLEAGDHQVAQLARLALDVDGLEQLLDRLGAHLGPEAVAALLARLAELLIVEQPAALELGLALVDDDIGLEVQDALQIAQRDVQQVADAARQALEEPDVAHRRGQRDVAQALAPHAGLRHLDAALVADDPAVLHPLELAAEALPVGDRAEDLGAEQAVAFGLERAVVDRLRLGDLAVRPRQDLVGRRQADANRVEVRRELIAAFGEARSHVAPLPV